MNEKISSELYEAAQKLKNEMEELQEEEFQDINDARRRNESKGSNPIPCIIGTIACP
jgi:hypothetical protein